MRRSSRLLILSLRTIDHEFMNLWVCRSKIIPGYGTYSWKSVVTGPMVEVGKAPSSSSKKKKKSHARGRGSRALRKLVRRGLRVRSRTTGEQIKVMSKRRVLASSDPREAIRRIDLERDAKLASLETKRDRDSTPYPRVGVSGVQEFRPICEHVYKGQFKKCKKCGRYAGF